MILVQHILKDARQRLAVLSREASVFDAAGILADPATPLAVVCDDDGVAVGVISRTDIIKLLFKEELRPKAADRFLFYLAPVISATAAFSAFAVVPFGAPPTFFGLLSEPVRLSPADPACVEPGRDGVMVRRGRRQGLLLPQVATEQGWDAESLLAAVCRKAGLPDGAWRLPDCELYVFQADVFGE